MSNKGDTLAGKQNMGVGMRHWNGNLLCAIDTETTGFDPELNEIVEISIIPLDAELNVHSIFQPLNMYIRPEKLAPTDKRPPGLTDAKLADYMIHGVDSHRAAELLTDWFDRLNLGGNKKLMPLAHNWPFDMSMIRSWLGVKNYEYIFHGHYRDTMALAKMLCDSAEYQLQDVCPYQTISLKALTEKFGIPLMNAHTANADALATAQVYKAICNRLRNQG